MKKHLYLFCILNLFSYLTVVLVNGLAVVLPLNNRSTGALSDSYPNLFVPAGITFSIWGVIYLMLLSFCIYQIVMLVGKRGNKSVILDIGMFFFLSSIFNVAWIFAWHYERILLSFVIMLLLLFSLIVLYLRLDVGKKSVSNGVRFFINAPISVYLGWISIATIANATALLVDAGWSGGGISPVVWTISMLGAGTLLSILILHLRGDMFYSAVVVWAFAGIIIKRSGIDLPSSQPVIIASYAGITIIILFTIFTILRNRFCKVSI